MLVLSRKTDESIVINDEIVITVLALEGDKVKLGIQAPRQVEILRQELWQALEEQEHIAEQLAADPKTDSFTGLRELLMAETSEA